MSAPRRPAREVANEFLTDANIAWFAGLEDELTVAIERDRETGEAEARRDGLRAAVAIIKRFASSTVVPGTTLEEWALGVIEARIVDAAIDNDVAQYHADRAFDASHPTGGEPTS